jgi:peptidoglycan-associated lipoprotein
MALWDRNSAAIALLVVLAAGLHGCSQTARPASQASVSGATDEPVPGYVNIQSGSEEDFIMEVGRRVYFASGSAELDDVTRETLDLQAEWLIRHPKWLAKLQGYADDPGGALANVALSDKRARAVMEYLSARGVAQGRLWAKGYGTQRQVRDCSDVSCKALNRRVVVNLRSQFDAAAPQYAAARR